MKDDNSFSEQSILDVIKRGENTLLESSFNMKKVFFIFYVKNDYYSVKKIRTLLRKLQSKLSKSKFNYNKIVNVGVALSTKAMYGFGHTAIFFKDCDGNLAFFSLLLVKPLFFVIGTAKVKVTFFRNDSMLARNLNNFYSSRNQILPFFTKNNSHKGVKYDVVLCYPVRNGKGFDVFARAFLLLLNPIKYNTFLGVHCDSVCSWILKAGNIRYIPFIPNLSVKLASKLWGRPILPIKNLIGKSRTKNM